MGVGAEEMAGETLETIGCGLSRFREHSHTLQIIVLKKLLPVEK